MPQASAVKPPKPAIAEKLEWWGIDRLRPYARNSRTHSSEQIDAIAKSMQTFGWTFPILVQPDGTIIAGHARLEAAKRLGFSEVKVLVAEGWSPEQVAGYVIADNKLPELAGWNESLLAEELAALKAGGSFDLSAIGFSPEDLAKLLEAKAEGPAAHRVTLADRFGIAPFSVINAREGWWQDRKRAWIALGIKSEVGRGENLLRFSDTLLEPDPAKRAAKRKAA